MLEIEVDETQSGVLVEAQDGAKVWVTFYWPGCPLTGDMANQERRDLEDGCTAERAGELVVWIARGSSNVIPIWRMR